MSDAGPVITIAICTLNRADSLDRTLTRLGKVRHPPAGQWEVVVVDNGSSDHTARVITDWARHLPLRGVHESTPGLSAARNRAVREARGDWILWTDDDVLVGDDWLSAYASEIASGTGAGVLGGPVRARPDVAPDEFVKATLRLYPQIFAVIDLGDERHALRPGHVPYGANMAIRKALLEKNGFDTALGSRGGTHLIGEDTVMLDALLGQGVSGTWLPAALVDHCLPAARLNAAYVADWAVAAGRTHVREATRSATEHRSVRRIRCWLWRHAMLMRLRAGFTRTRDVESTVKRTYQAGIARGVLAELRTRSAP